MFVVIKDNSLQILDSSDLFINIFIIIYKILNQIYFIRKKY